MKLENKEIISDSHKTPVLKDVTDIHIHTAPDIKPRLESDIEAALNSKRNLCIQLF
ncbi:MAG: hypothetical protein NKF70_02900 [Methanobacterium sp. ERen5]|nr:MAG: hypothetical protein NKF70_02900 [Methanobacterium sp. ERen5]